jgi:hypothetical protein
MTISKVTTERLIEIVNFRGAPLTNSEEREISAELLAAREAQSVPVPDEIYAELYRLRIENKGPEGFETWKDAAIFERGRRMGAERKIGGEEMTYLEAMALLTKEDAQNLSAIEAFRRGASYSGKINAHALRDSMRYQFLRDKDAFGAENEPGLAGWGELIDLDGNEFDAAIDERMAHPDIAYTAPPAPAASNIGDWKIDTSAGAPILTYKNCSVIESEQAEYVLSLIKNAEQPVLAVREAQPVAYRYRYNGKHLASAGCGNMVSSWKYCEEVGLVNPDERYECQALFATPTGTAVPADYQHLKHVSESYFAVEKRLFDLAQRLKGPSFDHYAYSLNQAIDVLDKEIFGEGEDNSAMLAAAPTPTK